MRGPPIIILARVFKEFSVVSVLILLHLFLLSHHLCFPEGNLVVYEHSLEDLVRTAKFLGYATDYSHQL